MINVLFKDEESPDIDFIYADSDNLGAELAELYSYTEQVLFGGLEGLYLLHIIGMAEENVWPYGLLWSKIKWIVI